MKAKAVWLITHNGDDHIYVIRDTKGDYYSVFAGQEENPNCYVPTTQTYLDTYAEMVARNCWTWGITRLNDNAVQAFPKEPTLA
jgi:hypothetical protein